MQNSVLLQTWVPARQGVAPKRWLLNDAWSQPAERGLRLCDKSLRASYLTGVAWPGTGFPPTSVSLFLQAPNTHPATSHPSSGYTPPQDLYTCCEIPLPSLELGTLVCDALGHCWGAGQLGAEDLALPRATWVSNALDRALDQEHPKCPALGH